MFVRVLKRDLQELKVEAVKGEAKALREVLQQQRPQTARSELDSEADQATCSLREQLAAAERRCWEAEAKLARLPDLERRCHEAEVKLAQSPDLERRCQEAEQKLTGTERRCLEAEERLEALGLQVVSSNCKLWLCISSSYSTSKPQEASGSDVSCYVIKSSALIEMSACQRFGSLKSCTTSSSVKKA